MHCISGYPVNFTVVDDGSNAYHYEGLYHQTGAMEQGKPVWKKSIRPNVYFYYHGKYWRCN